MKKLTATCLLPIAIGVTFLSQSAHAGSDPSLQVQHRSGPGDYHNVAIACGPDYAKFCPNRVDNPDGREIGFCLKFRKSDLALGCRHAIESTEKQPTIKHKARRSKKASLTSQ